MKEVKTDRELYQELLDANEMGRVRLSDFDIKFLDSVSSKVSDYGGLTKKQRNKLEQTYDYFLGVY
jgi:hypothetical protein